MNDIRRAALSQIAAMLEPLLHQATDLLDAERQDVQDLPDNIEDSDYGNTVLKRPMFALSAARVCLLESIGHIRDAVAKPVEE